MGTFEYIARVSPVQVEAGAIEAELAVSATRCLNPQAGLHLLLCTNTMLLSY